MVEERTSQAGTSRRDIFEVRSSSDGQTWDRVKGFDYWPHARSDVEARSRQSAGYHVAFRLWLPEERREEAETFLICYVNGQSTVFKTLDEISDDALGLTYEKHRFVD